jgi:hypothetical protein
MFSVEKIKSTALLFILLTSGLAFVKAPSHEKEKEKKWGDTDFCIENSAAVFLQNVMDMPNTKACLQNYWGNSNKYSSVAFTRTAMDPKREEIS